jgi:hypothetical protein
MTCHDDERNTSRNFPAYGECDEPEEDEEAFERRPSLAAVKVMDEAIEYLKAGAK